jgi:hypothetical protein
MTPKKDPPKKSAGSESAGQGFQILGQARFEELGVVPDDMKLSAYAFDSKGQLLGQAALDAEGSFAIPVRLKRPAPVELVVGPTDDPQEVRCSTVFSQSFTESDWVGEEGGRFLLRPEIYIARYLWWPWRPVRVCITGHVRKISNVGDSTVVCPVPFVKVEIFDVDRDICLRPHIIRQWDRLIDRRVVRAPELLTEIPIPVPGPNPVSSSPVPQPVPIPGPVGHLGVSSILERKALNPQPLPPFKLSLAARALDAMSLSGSPAEQVAFSSHTDSSGFSQMSTAVLSELSALPQAVMARLSELTITSKVAPWLIFPRCFYSRKEICETTTNCDGYFRCCFKWYPWHVRRGRLRFDPRPDIIVRVTQIIGGVETVIYMDPYSSTRWNVTNAHIDLWLDNEEVICGSGCQPQPEGTRTYLTKIGLDDVYNIDQTTGLFSNLTYGGGLSNVAYGNWLLICGLFGEALSTGAPKRFYRLSIKKGANNYKPITTPLSDTRVDKTPAANSDSYPLGPQTVNGVPNLYEVRDTTNYSWYNLDEIGWWDTESEEPDAGLYTIRLEVFDDHGVKLSSAVVDYRNGAVPPPGPLPAMVDSCDLNIMIDNCYPSVDLQIPKAKGDCGVVPWDDVPALTFDVHVDQAHNRVYYWSLRYVKGLTGVDVYLTSNSSGSGLVTPVNVLGISGAPLVAGLTTTCAFSLTLDAWPLVRNGFGFIHYNYKTKAIAIEKCV